MRWRQSWNEELGKHEFIPIDDAARQASVGSAIHGDITPFVSPVDGSVISDRRQLREHNKRNNVVNASEFEGDHYEKIRKDRERMYTGERTPDEVHRDKQEIYNTIDRLERQGR